MTEQIKDDENKTLALRHLHELPRLIERMHRRYLDVVRLELSQLGVHDVSPVQVMMIHNIGVTEIAVRDLIERGYYLGSNASYNLKQLVEGGYVERQAAAHDRRAARLKLTAKGLDVLKKLIDLEKQWAEPLLKQPSDVADVETSFHLLRQLEHRWSDAVRFAGPAEEGDFDL